MSIISKLYGIEYNQVMDYKHDCKDLTVWKKSLKFVKKKYQVSAAFPDEEKFGLTNQLRRAAVSIPSNIAEGSSRSRKDFIRFLQISKGSLNEVETQLMICQELGYSGDFQPLIKNCDELAKCWLVL